jgi:pimeloyl-ACP methyl ester carboxylesterase
MTRGDGRRRHHRAVVATVALGLAVSCSTQTAEPPAPTTTAVDALEPLEWEPCGNLQCATLEVPLDHDETDDDGAVIELAVARRPATDARRRIGALLVNPGGPGASGVEYLRSPGLTPFSERFDVVSWDPRAVGGSTPLRCATEPAGQRDVDRLQSLDPEPDDPAEQQALDRTARSLAERCATLDADYLAHLDTTVHARDLDRLRRALGESQISYLGYSYGTLLGQEYARLFPTQVRAMALDGVIDPTEPLVDVLREQAIGLDAVLEPVGELFDDVATRLERAPIPAGDAEVGPADLAVGAFAASYSPGGIDVLRRALLAAQRGDGRPLGALASLYRDAGEYLAYVAVLCADGPRPDGAEAWADFADDLGSVAPRLGPAVANEVIPCAFWTVEPTRQPEPPPELSTAVLVIGTTGDVATPSASAVRVAEALPNAVLLTHESTGHTAVGSRCVTEALLRYLVDLSLPGPDTVCTS